MNVIGLDVSKDTIDATLITTKGSKGYIKISNNIEGFENLLDSDFKCNTSVSVV